MATLLVQSPEICRLLDDETGQQLDAFDVVGDDRDQVMVLYKLLHLSRKTGDGRLLYALCGVPVYMCSAPDRQHFFFKHIHEDGSCPAVTMMHLTRNTAMTELFGWHSQSSPTVCRKCRGNISPRTIRRRSNHHVSGQCV